MEVSVVVSVFLVCSFVGCFRVRVESGKRLCLVVLFLGWRGMLGRVSRVGRRVGLWGARILGGFFLGRFWV